MISVLLAAAPSVTTVTHTLLALGFLAAVVYVVYQRYFHPLAKYPGPFLASLTDLWQAAQFLGLQQPYHLTELHDRYGEFVRYGPEKLSVTCEDAVPTIYQKGARQMPKTEFYDAYGSHIPNVFGMRDEGLHALRRRHMSHSFSPAYVKGMEPYLDANIRLLRDRLDEHAASGAPFDLKPLLQYYVIDVLGELAFGQSFGLQSSGDASRIPPVVEHSLLAAVTGAWPAMTRRLKAWLPYVPHRALNALFAGRAQCASLAAQCVRRRMAELKDAKDAKDDQGRRDILTNLILATHPDTGEHLRQTDLEAEAFGFIIAGTHTTSATTTLLLYHLLHAPDAMARAVEELDAKLPPLGPDQAAYSVAEAEALLSYLRLCIRENFRLTPVFTMPLARRVMAPEGVVIGGEVIPKGTSIAICNHAFHHNAHIWGADHNFFDPARWEQPAMATRARYLMHFGLGGRQCIGKTVAQASIYKLCSTLLRQYEFQLADAGERAAVARGDFHGKLPGMVSVGISDLEGPLMVTARQRMAVRLYLYKPEHLSAEDTSGRSSLRPAQTASARMNVPSSRLSVPKRARAPLACNTCRQTKSKCDSERPACGRCTRLQHHCVYTQSSTQDKRLGPQEERRARWTRVAQTEPSRTPAGSVLMARPRSDSQFVSEPPSNSVTSSGSAMDMVATGAFDGRPATDVGHFGPSSNFSLFQALTQAISRLSQPMAIAADGQTVSASARPPLHRAAVPSSARPGRWISEFLDGVGAVLLYVDKTLLTPTPATARPAQALLCMVDAHARASADDPAAAELHYRRARQLLLADEQEVGHARLETVQALLLLASYQQNSQRAMASLTSHVLAVKAAYQLGLHCRASYAGLEAREQQLRARLWYGVVMQDVTLSAALGRPCLIPSRHVRPALFALLESPSEASSSVRYFCSLVSLHEIVASAVDSLYDANVGSPLDLLPADLVTQTTDLLARLAQWRASLRIRSLSLLDDTAALAAWTPPQFHAERYRLLLSLHHYKAVMVVCGPVLMVALRETSATPADMHPSAAPDTLRDASVPILQDDVGALYAFQCILSAILARDPSFLRHQAAWWMCNFTVFTMCLHQLALWVLCAFAPPSVPTALGLAARQAETRLLDGLQTLQTIGASSVMSFHAHRRLQQYVARVRRIGASGNMDILSVGADAGSTASVLEADGLMFHDTRQLLLSGAGPLLGQAGAADPVPSLEDLFFQLGDNDLLDVGAAIPPHLNDAGGLLVP